MMKKENILLSNPENNDLIGEELQPLYEVSLTGKKYSESRRAGTEPLHQGYVPDEFCALKYDPVPTRLYDAVKELNHPRMILSEELSEVIQFAGEDAPNVLLPKREANLKFLSKSEIEALKQSIEENESLTFGQLMRKSHDEAWEEANSRTNGTNVISPISMAKVLHADDAMLEYIEEQMQIESALK